ncbi:hypothetical protein HII31_05859 [Pseudocercospora fuligena]|uniref:Uncharacterized protein n=1 Tax=Pseudocercospora fuligena TaxID=685502 RepID=A0A8H6RHX5_9PEZI|nr:hypothetical protein HII31_05859 [Pseudocercospora fuligena]
MLDILSDMLASLHDAYMMSRSQAMAATPSDDQTSSTTRCRFLELPAELRNHIYRFVANGHLADDLWNNQPGLLHIENGQVREEFADIWYNKIMVAQYYDLKESAWKEAPDGIVKIVLDSQQDGGDGVWIDGSRGKQACKGVFSNRLKTREDSVQQAQSDAEFDSDWNGDYPDSYIANIILELNGQGWNGGINYTSAQINAAMISREDQRLLKEWFVENKLSESTSATP